MVPQNPMGVGGGIGGAGGSGEFAVYQESASKIYVPKYFGLQRFGPPQRDAIPEGAPIAVRFEGGLREEQARPVRAFLEAARDPMRRGGILSLPCGAGKTVIALHLLAALGRKTLIVVHKDFLLNQWRERIAQFLPGASVGTVKAKTVDVAGRDVVIGSLQSLSMKEYGPEVLDGVGFLIIDECHRVGTEVFSRALNKTNFRYSLGLSATVTRKDGMTKAFVHFLGDVLYKGSRRQDAVDVVQRAFFDADPAYRREELIGALGKPNMSRMINNICAFGPRTAALVAAILRVVRADPGRKVLVLSDRKSQLSDVRAGVEAGGVTAGFYWGGMKPEALAESETKQVMCATFAYAAEGMDVPDLDTLFLASPKSDIEQSVGRILRRKADARARAPLIYDVVDDFSLFGRQGAKRRAFYKKHKYRVWASLSDVEEDARARCSGVGAGPANAEEEDEDDDAEERGGGGGMPWLTDSEESSGGPPA